MKSARKIFLRLNERLSYLSSENCRQDFDYKFELKRILNDLSATDEQDGVIATEANKVLKKVKTLAGVEDFSKRIYIISSVVDLDGTIGGYIIEGAPPREILSPFEEKVLHNTIVTELSEYEMFLRNVLQQFSESIASSEYPSFPFTYFHINSEVLEFLCQQLIAKHFIAKNTTVGVFKRIFSGLTVNQKVAWIKSPLGTLKYFLLRMYTEKLLLEESFQYKQEIVSCCFAYRGRPSALPQVFDQPDPSEESKRELDEIIEAFKSKCV
jgi:hypothetical protein